MMGGLERPDQGKVIIDGKNLSSLEDGELAKYRNQNVGFIFQFHFLLPSITNLKNILLPCEIGGGDSSRVKKMALELADHLNVAHCLKKYPYQLSGGEQQRINIIRALSMRPKLLLCDEPTGNLDSENSSKVTELLKSLATEFGSTLVVVTHDRGIAHSFTDKFIMKDGRLNL
ncbi:MAG: lipoprotein-releasing system ATP-binding protein LolD [Halobacteriovoraceae bacterium]|nr:lipoprotein-releasing system ATP-binding protein LolD [Halobacteriovoraceae bacterium]